MDNYPEHFADSPNSISELTDAKGNGLFHLIASGERMSPHSIKAIDILKKHQVNPLTRNKDGQTALMMLRRKDERYRRIEEIMKSFAAHPAKKKKKNRKNKKNKDSTRHALHENSSVIENSFNSLGKPSTAPARPGEPKLQEKEELEAEHDEGPNPRPKSELEIIRDRLSVAINNLDVEIMVGHSERTETETVSSPNLLRDQVDEERPVVSCDTSHTQSPSNLLPEDKTPLSSNTVNLEDTLEEKDEFEEDSDVLFDNLTWEVECTSEVWKILNDRRLSPVTKKRIVKVIQQLANGHMRGHLAIRLEGLPKQNNILLFEAKLTKGARILWERAIAFSPRCSNNTELLSGKKEERVGRIYSDIIRIWDIVFDHETVPRKIENIVRSHKRGSSCIIKKQLKGFEVECTSSSSTKDLVCIPNLYAHKDDLEKLKKSENLSTNALPTRSNEVSTMFFPPGSPEDTEYHILKFYAFSNSLVNAVLEDRGKTNVDFPFRVSELEHAVINLKPNPMSSLLLLGRSGTGKTTCCLYRLWSNFQKYWQERSIDEPGIPRTAQFIPKNTEHNTPNDPRSCEGEDDGCYKEDVLGVVERNSFSPKSSVVLTANTKATANAEQESLCHLATCNKDSDTTDVGPTYEHLHQAFITKNAVLCTEVQKNFYDLSRACSSTRSHSEYQRPSSVNKFGQLKEEEWPFFVCSRDWLLMLDASLPEPAFFPRNDEGELLHTVKGWGEEDNHLQEIPGENSEDDDDEEYEIEPHQNKTEKDHNSRALSGMDGRREVTYQVFKNELWPKMTKKIEVQYHPTLVWTEIRSFIKGSVEALHCSHGHITLDEYQALGRKRAPNFSADREIVYELFEAYQRIKRSKGMFDEADLVYHIYHRLQGTVPEWSIHEIYVDETQDFTQAELSVIIRSCRDPNRLFFTGDTAQSIMRGIAFRFSDLKSLFYYMNQSYKAVGYEAQVHVPDRVYQLTHNYRSHAGILNLASSVIDLLLHFFPESFDRMKRDQGLFHGPKPVLLESCSFSDLAVILRGHKRKTSPIEFGAHQVVLVASDEVRDSLPEELSLALVMTVYEAKGLEFDDVLIYNFFKDSQVKERNTYRPDSYLLLFNQPFENETLKSTCYC